MAYDEPPDPYQDHHQHPPAPPYPSQYAPDQIDMPHPQVPPPAAPHPGSINEAVSSAVHQADTSSYLSPEVLTQITATVIQQLKATGLENFQPSPSRSQSQPPPPQQQQPPPPPPPTWPSAEPSSLRTQPDSPHSMASPSVHHSHADTQYNPYPPPSGYASDVRPSPKQSPDPLADRRNSLSSQGSARSAKTDYRPKPPDRDATAIEMTTLEKIWGKLFEDGKPTKRLGQFLRGIAMHLIEDYPPGNTLVVVPDKLQKFYKDTHVSWDTYPWQDIFDDRTSSISRLFRVVQAEHCLVQAPNKFNERPDIPGLTPRGFEKWLTLMILANPDREYERLQKAVLNMPINNPDDKKERFPKEIPRQLFPKVGNLDLREETEEYIIKHCGVDLPHITEEERSKAASKSSPTPTPASAPSMERMPSYERGRPPPSASSSSAVLDDEDETISPAPIERERKPYSVQPGSGKVYDDFQSPRNSTGSFSTTSRPDTIGRSELYDRDRDPLYARSGSVQTQPPSAHRIPAHHGRSRSSSRSVNHPSEYRRSEGDLLGRDGHIPRYAGVSAGGDLYSESPSSTLPFDSGAHSRDHLSSHRGSRAGEDEYYRGMLGGQGGGPVHERYYR
ncbi:hypothetical protein N7474_003400 [Penicillium riverlandense]|uniref:uncharacterized protein n=1 Tax=Penicillium riverlandense TaxID=1903569 RepID=UPI002547ECD7|nr:uncharacterized protein N7474_003400 [Penicillium riverlandense]KAJ5826262.1 hypothetical protein N7474_003400 [Penicillium riverlandense]